ncbi:nuclear nucleic acid-binding protein C1D [Lepeophtheirus salmonis]|uniref:Nuclear nucleic acid-binding protein C1D n=1 Tax=Lepeophtheirus salmonis TaxID=72036 RepID=C1BS40_LEPSM|nr:nuclear nucleic acid-binding protein C1D-like [Lepeophtheirus salmonis]XP_040579612.1 nuclear nucleic acid-binding protein C1D-like [Lepeophtheirus salmonis]ACO11843.1 Nuclear nucleic acid-binding protein C1D [Lepeophtheirus salmonis]ADD38263.1 Nuclear nucleic acid-binding protein C1D [Lepeophtheirus salmonis]
MSTNTNEESFPQELKETITDFHMNLKSGENVLGKLLNQKPDLDELTPVERARLELVSAFALNSLVWVSLRTKGVNPKDTQLKAELDRIKLGMLRLKEIKDKARRGKINLPAAKRFIKAGIHHPAERSNDKY